MSFSFISIPVVINEAAAPEIIEPRCTDGIMNQDGIDIDIRGFCGE